MTNTWLTAKGSKIELTTECHTSEIIDLDGHKVTVKADRIDVVNCTVNGQKVNATLTKYQGKNVLNYGTTKVNGTTHPLMILMPDNVYQAIWGEYDRRIKEQAMAEIKAEAKYQENRNKVLKAMAE